MPDMPFVLRIWLVFLANIVLGVLAAKLTREPEAGQPVLLSDIGFGTIRDLMSRLLLWRLFLF